MPIPRSWPGATITDHRGTKRAPAHVMIDRQRQVKIDGQLAELPRVTDVRFPTRGHAVMTFADGMVWNVELRKGCGCGG